MHCVHIQLLCKTNKNSCTKSFWVFITHLLLALIISIGEDQVGKDCALSKKTQDGECLGKSNNCSAADYLLLFYGPGDILTNPNTASSLFIASSCLSSAIYNKKEMKIDLCLACNHTIEIAPDLIFFLKEQQTLLNVLFYFLQKEIKLLHQMSTGSLADFLHQNCNTFSPSDILLMWKPQEWEQNKKEGYNFATIVPVVIVAVNLQFNKSDHIASLHDQIALMRLSL